MIGVFTEQILHNSTEHQGSLPSCRPGWDGFQKKFILRLQSAEATFARGSEQTARGHTFRTYMYVGK